MLNQPRPFLHNITNNQSPFINLSFALPNQAKPRQGRISSVYIVIARSLHIHYPCHHISTVRYYSLHCTSITLHIILTIFEFISPTEKKGAKTLSLHMYFMLYGFEYYFKSKSMSYMSYYTVALRQMKLHTTATRTIFTKRLKGAQV
jgi:hypothetical protein